MADMTEASVSRRGDLKDMRILIFRFSVDLRFRYQIPKTDVV